MQRCIGLSLSDGDKSDPDVGCSSKFLRTIFHNHFDTPPKGGNVSKPKCCYLDNFVLLLKKY